MKYAPLVLRNLSRNRRRSCLTALAIGLAAFTYTTLSGLPYLMSHVISTPASARRVVTTSKSGFMFSLPESYRRKIQSLPHVRAVSGIAYLGGIYRSPSDQLGIAVDADAAAEMWPDWGINQHRAQLFSALRTACLVPEAMMRKYGWTVGQTINLKGTVYPVDLSLKIVDTLPSSAPADTLLFRRDYMDELLGDQGRINAYYVMVSRDDDVASVVAAIDETFANSADETTSESEAAWVSSFFDLRTLFRALNAVAALAIVAMSLVAANTMMIALRERGAEMAVMRAVGFRPSTIAALVVAESGVIGIAGGVVGCLIAYTFARLIPFSMLSLGPIDLFEILPLQVMVVALGLAALIGAAAGIMCLPAILRKSVAAGLRAVG